MSVRADVIEAIWFGQDPFDGYPTGLYAPDHQGWNSHHPYLSESVWRSSPRIIVEIGVWKGGSANTLAAHSPRPESRLRFDRG